jgi:N-acetylglutamate synthase-like GNAT family acetyltransferase
MNPIRAYCVVFLIQGDNMADLAAIERALKAYQEREVLRLIREDVREAVREFNRDDRRLYYRLQGYAGLECQDRELVELRRLLCEVSNGTIHTTK